LSKGTDLTVDKLRAAFQSEDPRTQLKGFYYTCAWLRSLKEKEPNVYSKWYEDIKKTWKKMDDASDKLDTSVDGNDNLTINGKSDPESIVAILDQIEDSEIQKIFQTLDKYGDYKRAVRWVQDVKQREGRQHGDDLIFDEAGDEPEKIVSKFKQLREGEKPYLTCIFMIHGESPATNLIQNAGRMVSGNDGGRDSSNAIVQAWNDVQSGLEKYKSASEQFAEVNNVDADINRVFTQLKSINTEDNVTQEGKYIDYFVTIKTQPPENAFARTFENIEKTKGKIGKLLFCAILLYHSTKLKVTGETKDIIRNLVPGQINMENIRSIFKRAVEIGKFDFPYNNLKTIAASVLSESKDSKKK
jgi:hypothetical protein